jgi:DNA-binding LytR/AlgR family response regulator
MHFGNGSTDESGNRGLLDHGDPPIREVLEAACEELEVPMRSAVSASAKHGLGSARVGKKLEDADSAADITFQERAPGQSTSLNRCLDQKQSIAIEKLARIALKAKRSILFINAADLVAVEAKGNYVTLLHTSGSHTLRESISTIEEKLSPHGFVRIHRSVLVNAALVEEIHPWRTGEYVLRMLGGREFTVSRTYKKNLQLLAQSWIGTEGFAAE